MLASFRRRVIMKPKTLPERRGRVKTGVCEHRAGEAVSIPDTDREERIPMAENEQQDQQAEEQAQDEQKSGANIAQEAAKGAALGAAAGAAAGATVAAVSSAARARGGADDTDEPSEDEEEPADG
jgi:L-lactate utilization protein LutC